MAIKLINANIEAGESLSEVIDCGEGKVIKIQMPKDWTFAPLTFQASNNGILFSDVMHPNGLEVTCTVFEDTAIIGLTMISGFVKFRSGTRDQPVPQEKQRTFAVTVDTVLAG